MRGVLLFSQRNAIDDEKLLVTFLALSAQQEGVVYKVSSGDSDFLMTVRARHRLVCSALKAERPLQRKISRSPSGWNCHDLQCSNSTVA